MFGKLNFLVIGILVIVMMVSLVSAAPTDSWDYIQPINISNANDYEIDDYQVEIDLTSSNVGANFNWTNNGDDLRFISSTGNEFEYYIESWNSGTPAATIIVRVDGLEAQTNTSIYMVYGNSLASAESNSTETYILYDMTRYNIISSSHTWDFEDYDGINWQANLKSNGHYGGDNPFFYFYDKNSTGGNEVVTARTYINYHSSSYNDYTYLNIYKYLSDGTSDGTTSGSYNIGRYQSGYTINTQIIKNNDTYTLTNSEGATINKQYDGATDQFHDGLSKLMASKYYANGLASYLYVDDIIIKNYAEEDVLLESTGSEVVYDPDDFVSTGACTYSGTGNWSIDLSDDCTINTDYDLGSNEITLTGTGDVTFNSSINVTNFPQPATNQNIYIAENANIMVS